MSDRHITGTVSDDVVGLGIRTAASRRGMSHGEYLEWLFLTFEELADDLVDKSIERQFHIAKQSAIRLKFREDMMEAHMESQGLKLVPK